MYASVFMYVLLETAINHVIAEHTNLWGFTFIHMTISSMWRAFAYE